MCIFQKGGVGPQQNPKGSQQAGRGIFILQSVFLLFYLCIFNVFTILYVPLRKIIYCIYRFYTSYSIDFHLKSSRDNICEYSKQIMLRPVPTPNYIRKAKKPKSGSHVPCACHCRAISSSRVFHVDLQKDNRIFPGVVSGSAYSVRSMEYPIAQTNPKKQNQFATRCSILDSVGDFQTNS